MVGDEGDGVGPDEPDEPDELDELSGPTIHADWGAPDGIDAGGIDAADDPDGDGSTPGATGAAADRGEAGDGETGPGTGSGGRAATDGSGRHPVLAAIGALAVAAGLIVVVVTLTRDRGTTSPPATTGSIAVAVIVPPDALVGRWGLVAADDTWVGYSVNEDLLTAQLPNTAEGRTTVVDGGLVMTSSGVTALAVNADLGALRSDDAKRDDSLRTAGLETDRFPKASFALTEPIGLTELPAAGQEASVTATGDLTLHGVTRPVEIPLTVTVVRADPVVVRVTGSLPITFADWGITPPDVAGLLKVQDHGELRVDLRLARLPDEINDALLNRGSTPGSAAGTPGTSAGPAGSTTTAR